MTTRPGRSAPARAYRPGLPSLVAPITPQAFRARYWQKRPLFVRGTPARLAHLGELFPGLDVDWILRHADLAKTVAMSRPSEHDRAPDTLRSEDPRALSFIAAQGGQLYISCSSIPGVRAWIESLSRDLGRCSHSGQADVYATTGGGLYWHYDKSDNFTIQLSGSKEWRYAVHDPVSAPIHNRATTEIPYEPEHDPTAMPPGILERSRRVVLRPGDMLYMPRGFWHATSSTGRSLSFNLNLHCAPWVDLVLDAVRTQLLQSPAWRQTAMDDGPTADALLRDLARRIDRLSVDAWGSRGLVPSSATTARTTRVTPATRLRRNPYAWWAVTSRSRAGAGDRATVRVHTPVEHTEIEVPGSLLHVLRSLPADADVTFSARSLQRDTGNDEVRKMLRALLDAGLVVPAGPAHRRVQ